jgi:membrane protein
MLPWVLGMLGSYDLTYGSLAGVMIALIFFFFIGLGLVMGAHLNAALAEDPDDGLEGDDNKEEPAS